MARKPPATPKLCGRCETFFSSIASETCPHCFAPLTELTHSEAQLAAQLQQQRLVDPEYAAVKAQEDEQFKQQSFGACLAVLCVTLAVLLISTALIVVAARQHSRRQATRPVPAAVSVSSDEYGALLPSELGSLFRQSLVELRQPGGDVPILHSSYSSEIQIYALPIRSITPQSLASFRLAVSLVQNQTAPPLISQEVHTKAAYYAIIGSNGGLVGDISETLLKQLVR